ncbi:MAG: large conductance mechanosensitive channel protein MscL [Propioniciclava sp.]
MKGFKDFIMQGNLVTMAVAVIIAGAFGAVVEEFTQIILSFISLFGGQPDFSQVTIPGLGINIGMFLTALSSFLIISAVVYFFVFQPYQRYQDSKATEEEPEGPSTEDLLTEIRDLLKQRNSS